MKEDDIITQRMRKIVGLIVMTVIVLIHVFRVGNYLDGVLLSLYYSYVSDLIIPFGIYFLLCIAEYNIRIFRRWYVKALIIIAVTTLAEILQFFGIYALGVTFDFIDILMYIIGVGAAVIIDRLIFKKFIQFWDF